MRLLLLLFASILLTSCDKDYDDHAYYGPPRPGAPTTPGNQITFGKAEKGPFLQNSEITVYELKDNLDLVGSNPKTTITTDQFGSYSFYNSFSLRTKYLLLNVSGPYYNEHFDRVSEDLLQLEAIMDRSNRNTSNINLFTDIIAPRIRTLLNTGTTYTNAVDQAQGELCNFLNFPYAQQSFQTSSITNDGMLLATSLIFQRYRVDHQTYNYTAELKTLLDSFRSDFRNDGVINQRWIIDTLLYNANSTELIQVRNNLEHYYGSQGGLINVPDFEQYVNAFQLKYSAQIQTNFVFPDSAVFKPYPGYTSSKLQNVLFNNRKNLQIKPYVLSAIVPVDSSLFIRITQYPTAGKCQPGDYAYGWYITNPSNRVYEYTSQRKNVPITTRFIVSGAGGRDSAKVEYFKNNDMSPFKVKVIRW